MAVLLCFLINSVWAVTSKLAATHLPFRAVSLIAVAGSFVTVLGFGLAASTPLAPAWNRWGALAFINGVMGAAVTLLYYKALSEGPVSIIIPVLSLHVIAAALAGWIIFSEPFSMRIALGVLFGVLSVVLLVR